MTNPIATFAQLVSKVSRKLNLGNGSTWPGHLALLIKPTIVVDILKKSQTEVILVVGTNGKTTTATMLTTILRENGKKVIQNTSGANLLNGVASTILLNTNPTGKLSADYAVFEVDENNVPIVLEHVTPKIIIALDLFRDQLDRYGELDSIAKKWNTAFQNLSNQTTLILNADDPLIAYLAKDVKAKVAYFGLSDKEKGQKIMQHAADSLYCPNCGHKLVYEKQYFSHLGIWHCRNCGVRHPKPEIIEYESPLPGVYNTYNTYAAVLTAQTLGVSEKVILEALKKVVPAFGRQEKLTYQNKNIQIFLSKNPVSMNESMQTIADLGAKNVLLILNDRIPDGRDISWIWDIDVEQFKTQLKHVTVSGDRVYDMALRLAYGEYKNVIAEPHLYQAIKKALEQIHDNKTLFILPTYSAMLEVRKILTGKKIL